MFCLAWVIKKVVQFVKTKHNINQCHTKFKYYHIAHNNRLQAFTILELVDPRIPLPAHFQSTSGPLPVHFRSTSSPFGPHRWSYELEVRCPINQFYKKLNFAKFADGWTSDMQTYGRTEKK